MVSPERCRILQDVIPVGSSGWCWIVSTKLRFEFPIANGGSRPSRPWEQPRWFLSSERRTSAPTGIRGSLERVFEVLGRPPVQVPSPRIFLVASRDIYCRCRVDVSGNSENGLPSLGDGYSTKASSGTMGKTPQGRPRGRVGDRINCGRDYTGTPEETIVGRMDYPVSRPKRDWIPTVAIGWDYFVFQSVIGCYRYV